MFTEIRNDLYIHINLLKQSPTYINCVVILFVKYICYHSCKFVMLVFLGKATTRLRYGENFLKRFVRKSLLITKAKE